MSLHPSQFPKRSDDGTRFEVGFDGAAYRVMGRTEVAGRLFSVATCGNAEHAEMVAAALERWTRDGETFPLDNKGGE